MKKIYFIIPILLAMLQGCDKEECKIYYDSKIPDSLEIILHTGDKVLFLSDKMDTMEFDIVRIDTVEKAYPPPLYSDGCYYYYDYYKIYTTYKNDSIEFTHFEGGKNVLYNYLPDKVFYNLKLKHITSQFMSINKPLVYSFYDDYYGTLDTFKHVMFFQYIDYLNRLITYAYNLQYGVVKFHIDSNKYKLFKIIKK